MTGAALAALVLTLGAGAGAAAADDGTSPPEPTSPTDPAEPAPTDPTTEPDPEPEPEPDPEPEPVSYLEGIATTPGTVRCAESVATAPGEPVLLVHGTGMSAVENWATSYAPYLAQRGRPVCTVALRGNAVGDVQGAIAEVADAIEQVHHAAGREIDVVGHSQGAYLPRAALRLEPALAGLVDDVVGLAGVYGQGSARLTERCAESCVPALHQLARGSRLLRALSRTPLPTGPDYSNIGSSGDLQVTPQPVANREAGSTSVLVQEVCPGRTMEGLDHALLAGDAVAADLVWDALDQPGAVDTRRVRTDCSTRWYAGFERDVFMELARAVTDRVGLDHVPSEPAVACRLLVNCRDLRTRGRVLHDTVARARGRRILVSATTTTAATVRVRVGRGGPARSVRAGTSVVLPVDVPRRLTGRRLEVVMSTRAAGDRVWVTEAVKHVKVPRTMRRAR